MNSKNISVKCKTLLCNTGLPALFTVLAAVLFLCTSPTLSAAGDLNISEFLSTPDRIRSGYFFIGSTLAGILRLLNRIAVASWWSIFSLAVTLLGTFIVLWFINKKTLSCDFTMRLFLLTATFVFIWECIIRQEVNFSHTSAMAGVSALLLLADLIDEKDIFHRIDLHLVLRIIAVILLFVLAVEIRQDLAPVIFVFPLMVTAYKFMVPFGAVNLKDSIVSSFKNRRRELMGLAVVVISAIIAFSVMRLEFAIDPGIRAWLDNDNARAYISDYTERYPEYDSAPEVYENIGIKKSWIDMVATFITSDTNHFSVEELNKMSEIKTPSIFKLNDFKTSLGGHNMLWLAIAAIIATSFALCGFRKSILPLLVILFLMICFGVYCVTIGRIEWRITASCILLGTISFFAMSVFDKPVQQQRTDLYFKTSVFILTSVLFVWEGRNILDEKGGFVSPAKNRIIDQGQAEVLEYINSNKDKVYLYSDTARFYTAYNMWASHPRDYIDNYFPLTAVFIRGCGDRLSSYGINDLYADMLERSDIRILYSNLMTYVMYPYLTDHYDPCIGISRIENCGGYDFIRFSRPRIPGSNKEAAVEAVFKKTEVPGDDQMIRFACDVLCVLPQENDTYSDYVININDTYTGNIYSYGLSHSDSTVYGTIWCMEESWSPSVVTVTLNGIDSDGNVTELGDITQAFELIRNEL